MNKVTYTLSMTSKGTFTLPAKIRKELGLRGKGDKLLINYRPDARTIVIEKPVDLEAMQKENAKLIPKNLPPFDLNKIREQKHDEHFTSHFN